MELFKRYGQVKPRVVETVKVEKKVESKKAPSATKEDTVKPKVTKKKKKAE